MIQTKQNNIVKDWNPKQWQLIEMLADLSDERTPQEKAMALGYSESWVYNLRRRPEFREAVMQRLRHETRSYLPQAYIHLARWMRSTDPDVSLKAIRLFLQAQGELAGDVNISQTNITLVQELEQRPVAELTQMLRSQLADIERLQLEAPEDFEQVLGSGNGNENDASG